jgi:hypothetical protein
MRVVLAAVIGALALLVVTEALDAGRQPQSCPTSAGLADKSKAVKPSSFAPQPKPPHNAYGTPVGNKILTKRVKKQPELHTSPLPNA